MTQKERTWLTAFLIVIGVAGRLFPHPWNTTPITSVLIFSSAYLGIRRSLFIFLTTIIFTDLIIGVYQWQIMLSVYGSFMLAGLIGIWVRKSEGGIWIFAGTLCSSWLFFLITNWAVWQFGTLYPHSFPGLMESYYMAIPFFRNALAGDLLYTATLFTLFKSIHSISVRYSSARSSKE